MAAIDQTSNENRNLSNENNNCPVFGVYSSWWRDFLLLSRFCSLCLQYNESSSRSLQWNLETVLCHLSFSLLAFIELWCAAKRERKRERRTVHLFLENNLSQWKFFIFFETKECFMWWQNAESFRFYSLVFDIFIAHRFFVS